LLWFLTGLRKFKGYKGKEILTMIHKNDKITGMVERWLCGKGNNFYLCGNSIVYRVCVLRTRIAVMQGGIFFYLCSSFCGHMNMCCPAWWFLRGFF